MKIEYSPDIRMLSFGLRTGEVAETVEIEPDTYVDVDAAGKPLGVEFLVADDFLPFIARHAGLLDVPGDLATMVAERRTA